MASIKGRFSAVVLVAFCTLTPVHAYQDFQRSDDEFGPVVRAYLGYLRNEQEVVDDRVSRREVSANYYRHNSNRIKALRQMAIRLARETHNDYLPELEAVLRLQAPALLILGNETVEGTIMHYCANVQAGYGVTFELTLN